MNIGVWIFMITSRRYAIIGILAIIGLSLSVVAQPIAMPHVIFGAISDSEGNLLASITVKVTNSRTGESLSVQTNNNGQYQADLSAMPSGYQVGDTIKIEAESGELSGSSEVSVSTGPNDQCNLVLEESTGIPFPAIGTLIMIIAGMAVTACYYRRK